MPAFVVGKNIQLLFPSKKLNQIKILPVNSLKQSSAQITIQLKAVLGNSAPKLSYFMWVVARDQTLPIQPLTLSLKNNDEMTKLLLL